MKSQAFSSQVISITFQNIIIQLKDFLEYLRASSKKNRIIHYLSKTSRSEKKLVVSLDFRKKSFVKIRLNDLGIFR